MIRSRRLWAAAIFALAVVVLWKAGLQDVLTFEHLHERRLQLLGFIRTHQVSAAALFVLVYVAVCAAMLPVTAVMMFAGGVLFGFWEGLVLTLIGATGGAGAAFLVSRHLLGKSLQRRFAAHLTVFNQEFAAHGATYLLTVRLIPIFPFWIINLLAGWTRMPLGEFLWTTAIGVLPSALVFSFLGERMADIRSLRDLLTPPVLLALGAPAVFALGPMLVRWRRAGSVSRDGEAGGMEGKRFP